MIDWLPQLITPALYVVMAAAAVLVIIPDWRITLAALCLAYLGAAILTTQLALLDVAAVRLITGVLAVVILGLTGSQVNRDDDSADVDRPAWSSVELPTGLPFRFLAAVMGLVVAWYLATERANTLPGLEAAPALNMAAYALVVLGLLNLGLTEEPMNAGTALLSLLLGFQLVYAAVEPSLAIVGLLAGAELAIALAVSYLLVQQYRAPAEQPES